MTQAEQILRTLENQLHDTMIDPSWSFQYDKDSYPLASAQESAHRVLYHARKYLEDRAMVQFEIHRGEHGRNDMK